MPYVISTLSESEEPAEWGNQDLQVKEHWLGPSGPVTAGVNFKTDGSNLRIQHTYTSTGGRAYWFVSIPSSLFNANDKIAFDAEMDDSGIYTARSAYFRVMDGSYDRSSTSDFPSGSPLTSKGNGELITAIQRTRANGRTQFTMQLTSAVLANCSTGYITVLVDVRCGSTAMSSWCYLYSVRVTDGSDVEIHDFDVANRAVHMEVTTTANDYGYLTEGHAVAGSFDYISDDSDHPALAAYAAYGSGTLKTWDPELSASDTVYCLINANWAPNRTLFIGGDFTSVDGNTRNRLAAIQQDATVDEPTLRSWNPNANGTVKCMLWVGPVVPGAMLYVGGDFTTISSTGRAYAACIEADDTVASPTLYAWDPNPNGSVECINIDYDNSNVYLGGAFTDIDGTTRNYVAAVDDDQTASNPTLRDWNPNCNDVVRAIALDLTNEHAYLGGDFTTCRGSTRNGAACVDSDTSVASPTLEGWDPDLADSSSLEVYSLLYHKGYVWIGGVFDEADSSTRYSLACTISEADYSSGSYVTDFAPVLAHAADPEVRALTIVGEYLYFGGLFTSVGGTTRWSAAAVKAEPDTAAPELRGWNPKVGNSGNTAAATVYALGPSYSV